ncbi:hypothetical protein PybrP1_002854 [[Pythium] brassicae (nom. inval.)]|nr:hypothetical protein PybrP1_002854 [[Pythium] brassicae (nom. inval.)]
MELPRLVNDEFIQHQIDNPTQQHMREVIHAAEVDVSIDGPDGAKRLGGGDGRVGDGDLNGFGRGGNGVINGAGAGPSTGKSNEHTSLLVKSPRGNHVIDLGKVEQILTREEAAAVEEDARLPAWAIVREEAVIIMKLGVPTVLLAILELIPSMALTIMVGHVVNPDQSAPVLAAYGLSDMIQGIFLMFIVGGVESATSTFCSQAFGGKRMVEFWLYCQAASLVLAASAPFMIAAMVGGSWVLRLLGQDSALSDLAGEFTLVAAVAVPFIATSTLFSSALQTQNIVVPAVGASVVSWSVAGTAAYVLAYHTSLGYLGVAMAIPICSVMKTLTLGHILVRTEAFTNSWPGWKPLEAMAFVPKVARLGLSSVLMMASQNVGMMTTALLAGALPNSGVAIAACNIFTSALQTSYMPTVGVAVSGAIRIGNALGAGRARRAALLSRMVIGGAVSVASVVTVVAVFVAKPFATAFTSDSVTVGVAVDLLHKLLVVIPLLSFMFGVQFIMRACGKQLLNAKLNFVTMFVISVPLAWAFNSRFHGGLVGLWLGNLVGMLAFTAAATAWLCTVSWEKLAHEAKHNTHLRVERESEGKRDHGGEAEMRQSAPAANAF